MKITTAIVIALMDTGMPVTAPPCPGEAYSYDTHGHASVVYKNIKATIGNTPHCIKSRPIWTEESLKKNETHNFANQVISTAPNVHIMSLAFSGQDGYSLSEKTAIEYASRSTIVVQAAGNNGMVLKPGCDVYPACYGLDIIVVGATAPVSNRGPLVRYLHPVKDSSSAVGYEIGLQAKKLWENRSK